ncbi:uncharacterized protein LOC143530236 [Bidens hawaiensis]|uniref:uncharacterized protein LOC143530236 n=1 Tax=Bidens hawaiensis TaxID=980011 RepID=UPI004049DDC6
MESIVLISKCTENEKVQYTSQMFKGEALEWWNTLIGIKGRESLYNLDWAMFKAMILKKFCPINEMDQIQTKLWNHKIVGTNLKEYNTKFLEYCRIVPHLVTPEINKVTCYIYGLPIEIRDLVRSHMPSSTESAMELAGYLMDGMIRNRDEKKRDDGKMPLGDKHYEVETADGSISQITEVLNSATISLADHVMPVRLLPMTLIGFDVVLGMDWLSSNQARILCNDKAIDIQTSNNKTIRITGDKEAGRVGVISKIKASSCLGKGCLAFKAYVTKEPEPKKMEEMPIVSEFQDVFPDELPGAPPDREVAFRIDLIPGTSPIAKSPYRLAPTEMKELKKQLDELLEKG